MNTQKQDIATVRSALADADSEEAFSRILERTLPECVVSSRFIVEYKDKQKCIYSPDDFDDKDPPRPAVLNAMKKMEE